MQDWQRQVFIFKESLNLFRSETFRRKDSALYNMSNKNIKRYINHMRFDYLIKCIQGIFGVHVGGFSLQFVHRYSHVPGPSALRCFVPIIVKLCVNYKIDYTKISFFIFISSVSPAFSEEVFTDLHLRIAGIKFEFRASLRDYHENLTFESSLEGDIILHNIENASWNGTSYRVITGPSVLYSCGSRLIITNIFEYFNTKHSLPKVSHTFILIDSEFLFHRYWTDVLRDVKYANSLNSASNIKYFCDMYFSIRSKVGVIRTGIVKTVFDGPSKAYEIHILKIYIFNKMLKIDG